MNDKRKEYLKRWREDNKEHIRHYKKEYAKTHDSSFKKLQDKYKQLQQENKQLKATLEMYENGVYFSSENDKLKEENKQLKVQLLVAQTNEETFRLEMKDITKILGLDEDTLFDDVKVYARSLKDNWNKLKEYLINDINNRNGNRVVECKKVGKVNEYEKGVNVIETISPIYTLMEDKSKTMKEVLDKMQELERSDNQ